MGSSSWQYDGTIPLHVAWKGGEREFVPAIEKWKFDVLPADFLQEFIAKEVIAYVSSFEGEAAVLVSHLCYLDANLTVLHHLIHPIT